MSRIKPKCGHSILRPTCDSCKTLLDKWYQKLSDSDPDWRDIEYGLNCPQLIYQPINVESINPETTAYYDKIWAVYHDWIKAGRSRRDCVVAELLAKQDGDTGTLRGIAAYLKSKKLKPSSYRMVQKTINEIKAQISQPRPCVEQAPKALCLVESKPQKDETNGKADTIQVAFTRAA